MSRAFAQGWAVVKAKETVVCADCQNTVPVLYLDHEIPEWADCPECGVTGIHDEERFGAPKPLKRKGGGFHAGNKKARESWHRSAGVRASQTNPNPFPKGSPCPKCPPEREGKVVWESGSKGEPRDKFQGRHSMCNYGCNIPAE